MIFRKKQEQSNTEKGYADGWEHFADELKRLDLRIRLQLTAQRPASPVNPLDQFKGLVVSEEEVYQLLHHPPAQDEDQVRRLAGDLSAIGSRIRKMREISARNGVFLPLAYLSDIFSLSPFEEQCALVCLALELDRKYEKLYAFLQDDVTCKYPTVDLVMKLLCASPEDRLAVWPAFYPGGKLFRYLLKKEDISTRKKPLLSMPLMLDERIISFLLDSENVDGRISGFTQVFFPGEELPPLLWGEEIQEKVRGYVQSNLDSESTAGNSIVFYFRGPAGVGKRLQVKHFCSFFNQPLMLVDLCRAAGSETPLGYLMGHIAREAVLQQAVLCFYNFNVLLAGGDDFRKSLSDLTDVINMFSGIVFLLSDCDWKPAELIKRHLFINIEFKIPQDFDRQRLWEFFSRGCSFEDGIDWGALAGKFRFTPGQIKNAVQAARDMASWRHGGGGKIGADEINRSCYAQVHHKLGERAAMILPVYGWDDIVLPREQRQLLKNACNQMRYRHIVYGQWGFENKLSYGKGLSMLFSGPPGTGKTMAAQVVAKELRMELYKIDISQVVSKYIGETEKNLQQVFHEAQLSSAILFFDESDALFGKRSEVKDAHDRYANIETAFLLQKVEEYEGITVLATNYAQNIDEAFMRRINFIIEFPFPDAEHREKIWRSVFPPEAPIADDVDFEFVSRKFELAGGNIKNIAVSAAFLAAEEGRAVGMRHIINAARYELRKMGKVLLREDLGEYHGLI